MVYCHVVLCKKSKNDIFYKIPVKIVKIVLSVIEYIFYPQMALTSHVPRVF